MKLKNDLSNLHEWTEHFGFPSLEPRIIELPESSHIRKMIETMECKGS